MTHSGTLLAKGLCVQPLQEVTGSTEVDKGAKSPPSRVPAPILQPDLKCAPACMTVMLKWNEVVDGLPWSP